MDVFLRKVTPDISYILGIKVSLSSHQKLGCWLQTLRVDVELIFRLCCPFSSFVVAAT